MLLFLIWSASSVFFAGLILIGRNTYFRRKVSVEKTNQTLLYSEEKEKTISGPSPPTGHPLPQSIINSDEDILDRGDWVQRLTSHVYSDRHAGKFNVLTIHTKIDHHFMPQGVVEKLSLTYTNSEKSEVIPYDIFVFRTGYLLRLGHGGYLNWCFEGKFDKHDNQVVFNEIV